MLWKVIWMRIPKQLRDKITLEADFTVTTVMPRLQTCRLGFIWRTSTMWNKLPWELRSIKSLPRLKNNLKKHIISSRVTQALNSTEENIAQVDGNTEIEESELLLEQSNWRMTTDTRSDAFRTAGRTGTRQPLHQEVITVVSEDISSTRDELDESRESMDEYDATN